MGYKNAVYSYFNFKTPVLDLQEKVRGERKKRLGTKILPLAQIYFKMSVDTTQGQSDRVMNNKSIIKKFMYTNLLCCMSNDICFGTKKKLQIKLSP